MEKLSFVFLIFALSVISFSSSADTFSVPRPDGTQIIFYLDVPNRSGFSILVGLQGSVCVTSFPMHQMLKSALLPAGIAVLSVEKRGLSSNSTDCPNEYLQKNTVQDRVLDHLEVMQFVRKNQPHWNHRIGLAGGSEGGVIAALVAPLIPETATLTLLASGGGLTMSDEVLLLTRKQMQKQGASESNIQHALDQMRQQFTEMRENPTFEKEWLSDGKTARNTYKWWSAILDVKLESSLFSLEMPIYMAHGTADTSCPIESTDHLAQSFANRGKSNLLYKRYDGLEHNWTDTQGNQHPEVLSDAIEWIINTLP
ncbi:MAG: prolyl oligopeptidase family serine peptidase [Bdellovibrionales bacterium]|nr:prolyl oligopeptidase family serine peptidase [Bdellovibrionales bacterium]